MRHVVHCIDQNALLLGLSIDRRRGLRVGFGNDRQKRAMEIARTVPSLVPLDLFGVGKRAEVGRQLRSDDDDVRVALPQLLHFALGLMVTAENDAPAPGKVVEKDGVDLHRIALCCDLRLKVNAALGLVVVRPPAGPFMVAVTDGPGAVHAPDARIALIVQRIVRKPVDAQVGPHVVGCPVREWAQLDDIVDRIPPHDRRLFPCLGLVPADAGDPGLPALQEVLQRHHLANPAAAIGCTLPERRTVALRLLVDGEVWRYRLDSYAQACLQFFSKRVRLLEKELRIQKKHRCLGPNLGDQVGEYDAGRAETGTERDVVSEGAEAPLQHLSR